MRTKIFEEMTEDYRAWQIGDTVYCLNNMLLSDNSHCHYLQIGHPYIIRDINTPYTNGIINVDVQGDGIIVGGLMASRFTKNPNHSEIVKVKTTSFDL